MLQIVNKINDLTKSYAGMKVPVKVLVDIDDKSFDVEIGTPTTSALIVKELGVEKGSGTPKATKVGNMSLVRRSRKSSSRTSIKEYTRRH